MVTAGLNQDQLTDLTDLGTPKDKKRGMMGNVVRHFFKVPRGECLCD